MKTNPATLMFEDMSNEDQRVVRALVEGVVLNGVTPWPYPDWLQDWFAAGAFDERQSLLVISTVFPQRALLSLLRCKDAHV